MPLTLSFVELNDSFAPMPEKTFTQVNRPQRELYEKGNVAMNKANWDYALAIYGQVLIDEPAFYECREALRAVQIKKHGTGTGFFKKMMGTAGSSPQIVKAQFALRNNPTEALTICEQILNENPSSTAAHKIIAEAALALDFPKTAVLSLEIALKSSPKDRELALRLAEALARLGNINRAETIYEELLKVTPYDPEISQLIKNLSAQRTMKEGRYDEIGNTVTSYRDLLKDKTEAVSLEQSNREVKDEDIALRLIHENEQKLAQEPNDLKRLRTIAELYKQRKDYANAIAYYERIHALDEGVDPATERALSDIRIRQLDEAIAALDPTSEDHSTQSAVLQENRTALVLDHAKKRVEKYPTDLQLRFELGVLYFENGKIGEAIQELQKAQSNPNRRLQAMNYLGQAFSKRNMNDLAARTFQNALKEKAVFDEEKKSLIYMLGCVLEKMSKKEEAMDQFKQIYEVDIGYKDVSARVDAYYSGI